MFIRHETREQVQDQSLGRQEMMIEQKPEIELTGNRTGFITFIGQPHSFLSVCLLYESDVKEIHLFTRL